MTYIYQLVSDKIVRVNYGHDYHQNQKIYPNIIKTRKCNQISSKRETALLCYFKNIYVQGN